MLAFEASSRHAHHSLEITDDRLFVALLLLNLRYLQFLVEYSSRRQLYGWLVWIGARLQLNALLSQCKRNSISFGFSMLMMIASLSTCFVKKVVWGGVTLFGKQIQAGDHEVSCVVILRLKVGISKQYLDIGYVGLVVVIVVICWDVCRIDLRHSFLWVLEEGLALRSILWFALLLCC